MTQSTWTCNREIGLVPTHHKKRRFLYCASRPDYYPETAFKEITERAELRKTLFPTAGLVLHGKEGRYCAGLYGAPCTAELMLRQWQR